jgi:uncharacterized membrane protein YagU involved in acid resistance
MKQLIKGAIAGLAATVPMTLTMEALHSQLPPGEQYALPPRLITDEVTADVGLNQALDEEDQQRITWVAHFSYGAAMGALYAPLAARAELPPITGGALYGLAVWAGSYLGWLPAAGILRSATKHPPRRTALMITAHLVWGATTGALIGSQRGWQRK